MDGQKNIKYLTIKSTRFLTAEMAGADGSDSGADTKARQEANEEARAAVANIFEVLCGQSDGKDKFTGLQRSIRHQTPCWWLFFVALR